MEEEDKEENNYDYLCDGIMSHLNLEFMGNFKELIVWQKAKLLAINVYKATDKGKIVKDFGLRDQIRRSSVSIASNIAEGDESGSDKLSIRYFNIAKGSSAELYTQLLIAEELLLMDTSVIKNLISECEKISGMLFNLIRSRHN